MAQAADVMRSRAGTPAGAGAAETWPERLTRWRYKYWPDHWIGEILSKRWTETAIPVLLLLLVVFASGRLIPNFYSATVMADTLRQAGITVSVQRLFLSGAALAYYVVMPTAFKWMLGFEGNKGGLELKAMPATGDYLGLVMQFILAFGISFLLPVLLLLLNRAGIVSRQQLAGMRRYVIVAITAVAAIITPPDVVSQLMLLVPMLLLFEGSLIVMWLGERKEAKVAAEAVVEPASPTE